MKHYLLTLAFVLSLIGTTVTFSQTPKPADKPNEWFIGDILFSPLYGHPAVLPELKLSEKQAATLKALRSEAGAKMLAGKAANPGPGGYEIQRKINIDATIEWQKKLTEALSPDQLRRLTELQIQFAGALALITPQMQNKLKMAEDQKTQAKKIVDEWSNKARALSELDIRDRAVFHKMRGKLHKESLEKARVLLTADQNQVWQTLKGLPLLAPMGDTIE
jgi:hypothetical protein